MHFSYEDMHLETHKFLKIFFTNFNSSDTILPIQIFIKEYHNQSWRVSITVLTNYVSIPIVIRGEQARRNGTPIYEKTTFLRTLKTSKNKEEEVYIYIFLT